MQEKEQQFFRKVAVLTMALFLLVAGPIWATQNYAADVVVIGGGAAGLSAALTAAQGGATVVVLEKDRRLGGTAVFAEGIFGVETNMQRLKWIGLTRDEVFNEEMDDTRWTANAPLVRRFHNQSASTIDWLVEQGVKFEGPAKNFYGNNPTWHLIEGHGAALIKALQIQIKKTGKVQILLQTPGQKLIIEKGRVVGVKGVNRFGEEVVARAHGGVIIATGGFANNQEMLKKYTGEEHIISATPLQKTGDGINMAIAAGAAVEGMSTIQYVATMDVPPGRGPDLTIGALGVSPRNVWVNGFGKRFANEYVAFDFPFAANAIKRQQQAWAIFDENLKHYYMTKGIDAGLGVLVPPGKKFPNFDAIWNGAIAAGNPYVAKAASLQALADKIHLPYENLKKTFAEYNKGAAVNKDFAFGKDDRWLDAIDTNGPLYAVKIKEVMLTTVGGVKVDAQLHPLNQAEERVVTGLYMTGNDVGGLYGDTYTLTDASGSTFGFAVNSGRMAAQSILAELNK